MIALATQLAERQLREGTASAQVITHYLRLGTQQSKEELVRLKNENELLKTKNENLKSAARSEELYSKAIKAFRTYLGGSPNEEAWDEEDV